MKNKILNFLGGKTSMLLCSIFGLFYILGMF